jgi:hypothetical protein
MAKKTTKKTADTQTPVSNPASIPTSGDSKMETAATNFPAETTNSTIKTTKKPELVASQARSNLVPISLDDEIRQLAYQLSERRGFQPGHETEDWLSAEREVRQRYHRTTASA